MIIVKSTTLPNSPKVSRARFYFLLLLLVVAGGSGCMSAWVGNSPEEQKHRHQMEEGIPNESY